MYIRAQNANSTVSAQQDLYGEVSHHGSKELRPARHHYRLHMYVKSQTKSEKLSNLAEKTVQDNDNSHHFTISIGLNKILPER